jgi:hypothetical protein
MENREEIIQLIQEMVDKALKDFIFELPKHINRVYGGEPVIASTDDFFKTLEKPTPSWEELAKCEFSAPEVNVWWKSRIQSLEKQFQSH